MAFPKRKVAVRVSGAPRGREKQVTRAAGSALKRTGDRMSRIGAAMSTAAPVATAGPSVPPMPPPGMSAGAGAPPGFKKGGKVGKAKARKH